MERWWRVEGGYLINYVVVYIPMVAKEKTLGSL
jgi:hypothetical protein